MKNNWVFGFPFFFIIIGQILGSSTDQPIRFKDKVFTEFVKTPDVLYGSNVDFQAKKVDLFFDFYEPKNDTMKQRPCIVFIHGGSFVIGDKSEPNIVFFCQEVALRGYIAVSIQYRLGAGPTKKAFAEAVLRAVQDTRAAVRFLRKNKETYRVDETKFVVGGTSAGGVTAAHYAYMDNDELPVEIDTLSIGSVEGQSGTPGVASNIHCIINCWGALADTTWLEDDETTPIVSIHGTNDSVVPYDAGFAFNLPFLPIYGSAAIDRNCQRLSISSTLQSYIGMGHGHSVDDPQMDTTLSVMVDFLFLTLFETSSINHKVLWQKPIYNRTSFAVPMHFFQTTRIHFPYNPSSLVEGAKGFTVNGKRMGTFSLQHIPWASGFYIVSDK